MLLNCDVGETFESPLHCKQIKPVLPKIFIGRTDGEAEAPIVWPPDVKNWLLGKDPDAGKDWRQEEKRATEDEMAGWHHGLYGHKFEQASSWWWTGKPGMLQSMGSQSRTRLSDWTELNWTQIYDIWERKRVHIFIDKLFPSNSIQNIDLANTFLAVVQWCIDKTKKKSMILQKVCSQVANIQNECFPFSQIQFEVFMFFRFMQSI